MSTLSKHADVRHAVAGSDSSPRAPHVKVMDRVETGIRSLDAALAGGVAPGATLLLTGDEGAGATEFALSFVRHVADRGTHARILSALRSPSRVNAEYHELFESDKENASLEIRAITGEKVRAAPTEVLEGLGRGDLLLIESADALSAAGDGPALTPYWRAIADAAGESGVVVMLLHSRGTLPPAVEAGLAEAADGVLQFQWHQSGPARRRSLAIVKLRGLSPMLDSAEVPVFEIALQRGTGFSVSRGRSVL